MPQIDEQILEKLDQILRVVAMGITSEFNQRDKIAFLAKAGLKPKDIATVIGTTRNTVNVALVGIRKKKQKRKKATKRRNI